MNNKTAILVDGGFYLKRYKAITKTKELDPKKVAKHLWEMCIKHLKQADNGEYDLYRIFYYDCMPYDKKHHNPINKRAIDFKKTEQYKFKITFLEELKKKRKIAIRLGAIHDNKSWVIRPDKTKELLNKKISIDDLTEDDVYYHLSQKRVDIKIGIDIASMALKKQVNQIILISGDSDFVPAAKLARREGIDFVLDNMHNYVKPHLFEHIDGMISKIGKPTSRKTQKNN